MIIEIDCGNTRAKWRQTGGAVHLHAYDAPIAGSALGEALSGANKVRVASVGDNRFIDALKTYVAGVGSSYGFARSERNTAGVVNSYDDVSRMGVDRWLAIVAAYQRHQRACVVVDAGTAMTVDCVDDAGRHCGGLIVPGKQLLLQSLNANTSKVRFAPDAPLGSLRPGCSTQDAVYNGAAFMLAGTVHEAVAGFEATVGHKLDVYIAGGDAGELMPALRIELQEWPDIVLDGLQYLVP